MTDIVFNEEKKLKIRCVYCGHNLVSYQPWVYCPNTSCPRTGLHTVRVLDDAKHERIKLVEEVIRETSIKLKERKEQG
jgi:hypothetical protein